MPTINRCAAMLLTPAAMVCGAASYRPTRHPPLEEIENRIHPDAHDAHNEERREHQRHIEIRASDKHHISNTAVPCNDFGYDRTDESQRNRDFQRRKEKGK